MYVRLYWTTFGMSKLWHEIFPDSFGCISQALRSTDQGTNVSCLHLGATMGQQAGEKRLARPTWPRSYGKDAPDRISSWGAVASTILLMPLGLSFLNELAYWPAQGTLGAPVSFWVKTICNTICTTLCLFISRRVPRVNGYINRIQTKCKPLLRVCTWFTPVYMVWLFQTWYKPFCMICKQCPNLFSCCANHE